MSTEINLGGGGGGVGVQGIQGIQGIAGTGSQGLFAQIYISGNVAASAINTNQLVQNFTLDQANAISLVNFAGTNDALQVTEAGRYKVNARFHSNNGAGTSEDIGIACAVNGTFVTASVNNISNIQAGDYASTEFDVILNLNAGDRVNFYWRTTSLSLELTPAILNILGYSVVINMINVAYVSQGIQGIQGLLGTQGTQGIQGLDGAFAAQGIQGTQGTQGTQGIQGQIGTQGTTGTGIQGIQGIQGVQGTDGSQGTTGTGTQGIQGATGAQGIIGTQGIEGIQGATGIQGTTGAGTQGIQGIQGTDGIQGATGVQGSVGNQGIQGVQGAQGTEGIQGATGIQGTDGLQGVQGLQGTTGIQGETGIQGIQGITGATGNTGAQGIQGITGIQGAIGTQGTQGLQGIQGVGNVGAQGIQGITGAQGIQGIQGLQGDPGVVGYFYSAYDTTSQTVGAINTQTIISFNNTYGSNSVTISGTNLFRINESAVYKVQLEVQWKNADVTNVTTGLIYAIINSTAQVGTTVRTKVEPSGSQSATLEFTQSFTAGDTIEFAFEVNDTDLSLGNITAAGSAPTGASAFANIAQVARTLGPLDGNIQLAWTSGYVNLTNSVDNQLPFNSNVFNIGAALSPSNLSTSDAAVQFLYTGIYIVNVRAHLFDMGSSMILSTTLYTSTNGTTWAFSTTTGINRYEGTNTNQIQNTSFLVRVTSLPFYIQTRLNPSANSPFPADLGAPTAFSVTRVGDL
jgi:hypothetical protein